MAAFCEIQDVKDKCGTTLDDPTITRLITQGARKVTTILKREGLGTSPSPTPDELIEANAEYSAALALTRHMTDGKLPRTQSISGAGATVDVQDAIKFHNDEGDRNMQEYINRMGKQESCVRVVGREGERIGEYVAMTKAQQEET